MSQILRSRQPARSRRPLVPGQPGLPCPGPRRPAQHRPSRHRPLALPSLFFQGTDANFNDFLDLSMTVPVIVDLAASWAEPSQQLSTTLERVILDYDGRLRAGHRRRRREPAARAGLPGAVGARGSRRDRRPPGPALRGRAARGADPRRVRAAAAARRAERRDRPRDRSRATAPRRPTRRTRRPSRSRSRCRRTTPRRTRRSSAATSTKRIAEYKLAIAQDPRDTMAVAGLAQVSLLARLQGRTTDEIRSAAAAGPETTSRRRSSSPTSTSPADTSTTRSTGSSPCSRSSAPPNGIRCARACSTISRSSVWTTRV